MKIPGKRAVCAGLLLAAILCAAPVLSSEGAEGGPGLWDIRFSLRSGLVHHESSSHGRLKISLPDYLLEETSYNWAVPGEKLSDNPLLHGAAWAGLDLYATSGGISINLRAIAEHRGMSYGTYAMDNIVFYPKYCASIDTSFTLFGQPFEFEVSLGNYDNQKLYEGLTIYNIDTQGAMIALKWKRLKVWAAQIGDMENCIGLNINDQRDFAVTLEGIGLPFDLSLDASAGYFDRIINSQYETELPDNGFTFSAGLGWRESLRLYSELGIRNVNEESQAGLKSCAHLVGCSYRMDRGRLGLGLTAERRYYGRYFNLDYSYAGEDLFIYRSAEDLYEYSINLGYGDTVGRQLYPLEKYFDPFSQWAVYTQYQGRDVQTMILRLSLKYALPADVSALCDLDLNYLEVSSLDSFLYPFYNAGVCWEPVDGITLAMSHTNRGMNLDTTFPTLYLYKNGTIMYTVQGVLEF